MIEAWEHHDLRRSRRDLYHLSHEVTLREAHAARQGDPAAWMATHDFRGVALLADAVETFAGTSRTGSRPPDAPAVPNDGINQVVLELADVLVVELEQRRTEATGSAVAAFDNLLDKAQWACRVLRVRE